MAERNSTVGIGAPGRQPGRPRVQPLVHGGFRRNRHHEGIEVLADERGMGRDILRQTSGGYPANKMEEGHARMGGQQPASRSGDMATKNSPWSGR